MPSGERDPSVRGRAAGALWTGLTEGAGLLAAVAAGFLMLLLVLILLAGAYFFAPGWATAGSLGPSVDRIASDRSRGYLTGVSCREAGDDRYRCRGGYARPGESLTSSLVTYELEAGFRCWTARAIATEIPNGAPRELEGCVRLQDNL